MTHYGIDPSTQPAKDDKPDRDDVKAWARRQATKFIADAKASFDKELAWDGNWNHSSIDFESIVDMLEDAAWDVVRKVEAE